MYKRANINYKSSVTIRTKPMKDNRRSIFLDIYIDGVRTYKFLKLYLVPETSSQAKSANSKTIKQAEKIRTDLLLELNYTRAGLEDRSFKAVIPLVDWMAQYEAHLRRSNRSKSFCNNILATRQYLSKFNSQIMLKDVDGAFIDSFITFLKKQKYKKGNTEHDLSHNTICCRIRNLKSALNYAVSKKLITSNPCYEAETRLKEQECKKSYLTTQEINRLIEAPCPSDILKRAFLFSVFTGIRLGDVRHLRLKNIIKDGKDWRIEICMQKTHKMLYLPLNMMARKWLIIPDHSTPNTKLFKGLGVSFKSSLSQWMAAASITKRVTYHTSRHTFAVLTLDAGVDLYTCSSLMGHSSIGTTQIYADIMAARKSQTITLLDSILD